MESANTLRYTRLSGLVKAVERLASAASLEEVVEIIRSSARRVIGADGITIVLREDDECHYVEEDAIGPLWKGQRFPAESCVSGWAMLHRDTAVISDIETDARVPYELYRETFVRSMVMAPIRTADPVGAIGAYWSEGHNPSLDAISAIETLARAAATSIENIRLVAALSQALADTELARDELRHRVGNAFSVAQALARLSLPAEHAATISSRIGALARAHELIDQKLSREAPISIGELVNAELEPYATDAPGRITVEGGRMVLPSDQTIALGLVLNELATNAIKYGALSTAEGKVRVRWYVERSYLVIEWEETDGPEIRTSVMEGFGSRLLRRLIEGQLRGSLTRFLDTRGVTCVIEVPGMAKVQATV